MIMTSKLIQIVLILTSLRFSLCQVPGGYNSVDCNDPGVHKAVKYAVDLFFATSPPPASPQSRALKKGKGKKAGKGKGKAGKGGTDISFMVYKAEEQVVAGMNYKISATAYVNGVCHGAREDVIIFQSLSGVLSVVDWGTRYNCSLVDDTVCLSA